MTKYARRCDATGRGINAGYVCNDDNLYFADKEHLLDHLRSLNWEDCNGNKSTDCVFDNALMKFFYNEDYYYYTEWDEDDIEDVYYDEEGNEYEC